MSVVTFMRSLFLLLFGAMAAFSQPFSFGVKGGVPLNDYMSGSSGFGDVLSNTTNPYIFGPEVELNLPYGLGVEVDALYTHYNFQSPGVAGTANPKTTTGAWELPVLLKYHLPLPLMHPFVESGAAWNSLMGTSHFPGSATVPPESNSTVLGYVAGVGVDAHFKFLHIEPEIRYTRWMSQHYLASPVTGFPFSNNQNEIEFLVGFTFGGSRAL